MIKRQNQPKHQKQQRNKIGSRRQRFQVERRVQPSDERRNRNRGEYVDAAQPRIDAIFQRLQDNHRDAGREAMHNDDQDVATDHEAQQDTDPTVRSNQLVGRPPDIQNLRTP